MCRVVVFFYSLLIHVRVSCLPPHNSIGHELPTKTKFKEKYLAVCNYQSHTHLSFNSLNIITKNIFKIIIITSCPLLIWSLRITTLNNVWLSSSFENAWLSEGWGDIQRNNHWVEIDICGGEQFPSWEALVVCTSINCESLCKSHPHVHSLTRICSLTWPAWEADKHRLCNERASKPKYKPPKLVNHLGQNKMMKPSHCAGQEWPSDKELCVMVC